MSEYITINEAVLLVTEAMECRFMPLPRKKILFMGCRKDGKTIALCTPQSKMHPQGFYWVDITQEQHRVMSDADEGVVVFRLEGGILSIVNWHELKQYLTPECMRYNANEQNHWKLNIYKEYIKISGNETRMPSKLYRYDSSNAK